MPSDKQDYRGRSQSPAPRSRHETSDRTGRHGDDHTHRRRCRDDDGDEEMRSHRHHHHHRSHRRKRSRSPARHPSSKRSRPTAASMMPDEDDDASGTKTGPRQLPLGARTLSRHGDYEAFESLFAHYLDLHHQIDVFELSGRELQQRWRSFVRRWNAGKLSEGWYDPEMFVKVTKEWEGADGKAARAAAATSRGTLSPDRMRRQSLLGSSPPKYDAPGAGDVQRHVEQQDDEEGEDSDDDYVPPLPPPAGTEVARAHGWNDKRKHHGPGIPSIQDLDVRRAEEEEAQLRSRDEIRLARRVDRAEQKERLDEILPRAAAGTRERQLEKKRMVNEKMRGFREGSAGATEEAGDGELMGEGGGVSDYKAALAREQRRKSEREVRKEAEARAKVEELRQRMKRYQEKEERTIGALRELARQKFGG
ncbi:hypothetical protein PpBr36_00551 [Pyricularia pennisetigena]|uniref:hypothetical protein n=1 Tax=Pyricularia pennisetigena TaxID=1578925 RepID=UPI00114D8241|nr:hypothetical protein PpBr36_00551 [Pyricularia pennisetigena]TLS27750.1 hypothetical protein PpBr36_00551 [Pyricularia pennisetigena]